MSECLSNTDLFNSLITAEPIFESPAETAEHRGWMAEYHAHRARQQAKAAEDPTQYGMKVSQYQVEAALCYFNANRHRAHMAEEYGAATEAYAKEIQDWLSSLPKDFPDVTCDASVEYIDTIGEEFVDAFGNWMNEEYNYLADAAEYRAQKYTQSYQCAQNCHMDDYLTVKRKAVATKCHDLAAAERKLAAKKRTEAARFLDNFAKNVIRYFPIRPIQNPVREVAHLIRYADCVIIIAKKAYVVGQWDSFQIITCLLSCLSASIPSNPQQILLNDLKRSVFLFF
jgi:hypothetical protein